MTASIVFGFVLCVCSAVAFFSLSNITPADLSEATSGDLQSHPMQKACEHCGEDSTGEVLGGHSARFGGQVLSTLYWFRNNLQHQFATYGEIVYGSVDYATPMHDPSDMGHGYDKRSSITGLYYMGLTSCIYEQGLRYGNTWTSHEICSQVFARGFGTYYTRECVFSEKRFIIVGNASTLSASKGPSDQLLP